jgi:hypothetical protein
MALLTAGIMPARTARRTDHVGYVRAWLVHVVSIIAAVPLWLVALLVVQDLETLTFEHVADELSAAVSAAIGLWFRSPRSTALTWTVVLAATELVFLLDAFWVMAWGAADEPLRSSFGRTLRRLWLHTAHLPAAGLLLCIMLPVLTYGSTLTRPQRPRPPPPSVAPDSPQWRAHEKKLDEYYTAKDRYSYAVTYTAGLGWLGRHWEETKSLLFFGVTAWWLWGVFRTVGAPRADDFSPRPPLCERCGYNLTGARIEGRCPECGTPVAASLNLDNRPGAPWERAAELGWLPAWWRCCVDSCVRPQAFGRQLKAYSEPDYQRWFLATCMIAAFGVGTIGYFGGSVLFPHEAGGSVPLTSLGLTALLVGGVAAAALPVLASLAAALVGMAYRSGSRRNLLPAAMQAACYSGAYILAWFVGMAALTAYATTFYSPLGALARALRISQDNLGFGAWIMLNVVAFLVYVGLIARITGAMRYANK